VLFIIIAKLNLLLFSSECSVYETGQMLVFLLIAKGWTITRDNFGANEWRGVIIALSAFYMSNSIIIVLQVLYSIGAGDMPHIFL
jgi:hypothetical protein